MAQTSILAVAVEFEIAMSRAALASLQEMQRRQLPIVVYGRPGVRTDQLISHGLVVSRLHQQPTASASFLHRLLEVASGQGPRIGSAQLLIIDVDEVRLDTFAALQCCPVICFNPTTETMADLRGRLADWGLVAPSQASQPRPGKTGR